MLNGELKDVLSLMIGEKKTNKLLKNTSSLNTRKIIDYTDDQMYQDVIEEEALNALKLLKSLILVYFDPLQGESVNLSSPEMVSDYLKPFLKASLGNQSREHFMVLLLNSSNKLIGKEVLFSGTFNQAQVYVREIIRIALIKNASAIICVHNHPSNYPYPSEEDKVLTKKLEDISKDFDLRVHDHFIVNEDSVYSMRTERML